MLYKNLINVTKLKNQDGDQNIFYFSHNMPPLLFFCLATLILFSHSIKTATYQ
jgi:hypothetical protein